MNHNKGLLYRIRQKWLYFTSAEAVDKKIAEINRFKPHICLKGSSFIILSSGLVLNRQFHSFILERYETFERLQKEVGAFFEVIDRDVFFNLDGVRVRITTAEELFIVQEVFVQKCYCFHSSGSDSIVIDVGMNVGFSSLFFSKMAIVRKVYGYEPFQKTFSHAIFNFELNPELKQKIIPFNQGVGFKNKTLRASFDSELKGKNSIFDRTDGCTEEVRIISIHDVIGRAVANHPGCQVVIKIDCEGAEFEIFECLREKGIPDEVKGFMLEWHFRDPQPIINTLLELKFKIHSQFFGALGFIIAFR